MKKLLDETTDDLTRALLEAGRSQRPPGANQAKVLVALGVGAGVGLFSAKAFAWLGTSAGKLTLLGVGLGIAGSVWVALPSSEPARVEAHLSPAPPPEAPSPEARPPEARPLQAPSSPVPAPVAAAPSDPGGSSLAGSELSNAVPARHASAPVAIEWRRRAAGDRKRSATRRDDAAQRREANPEDPLSAASASPPAAGAALASAAVASEAALAASEARTSGLESEIQLVDAMRGAAQRNDTAALRHLVESYRGTFPEGQLRQEVSELALRTLSPAR